MAILKDLFKKKKRRSVDGTKYASGTFAEEYLDTLRFPNAYDAYDKMRRQDYQIARVLRVLKAPLLAAKFWYEPEDFNDEEQKRQALYRNKFYFDHPIKEWDLLQNEIYSYLDFGHAVFEPYMHLVDDPELGKIWTLKDLGFISPKTITEWDIRQGELKRIHQQSAYGDTTDVWIPGDEVLVFTNAREGSNFQGISILRPAYGSYVRKDLYLKLDMIGNEKMSIGTPLVYVPRAIWDNSQDKTALVNMLTAFTSHESAFLLFPEILKDKFEIVEGKFNNESIAKSIIREDKAIVDLVLASFLEIGSSRTGGNAQNDGHMSLFLNSLIHVANATMKKLDHLSYEMYVKNFEVPKKKLAMKSFGISKDDENRTMEIIRGYITSEAIRPDDPLEQYLRNRLNLPLADPATARVVDMVPDYKADEVATVEEERKKQDNPEKPAEGE